MPQVDVPTFVDIISSMAEEELIEARTLHPTRRTFVVIYTEYTLEKGANPREVELRLSNIFYMKVKYIPLFHRILMWEYPEEGEEAS